MKYFVIASQRATYSGLHKQKQYTDVTIFTQKYFTIDILILITANILILF